MKIWKIECCAKCPKIGMVHQIADSYKYCYMANKSLSDINTFNTMPKWCPLENYGEVKNANRNL